jgi:hypothetical protein
MHTMPCEVTLLWHIVSGSFVKPRGKVRRHRKRTSAASHATDGWQHEPPQPFCLQPVWGVWCLRTGTQHLCYLFLDSLIWSASSFCFNINYMTCNYVIPFCQQYLFKQKPHTVPKFCLNSEVNLHNWSYLSYKYWFFSPYNQNLSNPQHVKTYSHIFELLCLVQFTHTVPT